MWTETIRSHKKKQNKKLVCEDEQNVIGPEIFVPVLILPSFEMQKRLCCIKECTTAIYLINFPFPLTALEERIL